MCIIQATGKDRHPGDFKEEAPKMGDYYANAECCISASLASDSSEGFLTERPLARFPIRPITLKFTDSRRTPPHSILLRAEEGDDLLEVMFFKSPLMQRGWYSQELMLSRRILHWNFHGLFLQCQDFISLEGNLDSYVEHKHSLGVDPRQILTLSNDEIISWYGWYELVGTFSSKRLTYETDRLYAIHGIASLLVQRLGAL